MAMAMAARVRAGLGPGLRARCVGAGAAAAAMPGLQGLRGLPGHGYRAMATHTDMYKVKTFNEISPVGLGRFDDAKYRVSADFAEYHAVLLRSHQLQVSDVPPMTRCVVRCGAGTNNCNVAAMTELGVPVFNTPGANANSVKELVLCGLLLSSRGIVEGITHMKELGKAGEQKAKIEKIKKAYAGREIKGKTLGVVGLGAIGGEVVEAALALGMDVVGYDPALSVEQAFNLPGKKVTHMKSLTDLMAASDFVTLHAPYIKDVTHHMVSAEALLAMRPHTTILNFARGELVDEEALKKYWDAGAKGRYVTDFAAETLWDHPQALVLPHLGASTEEAEDNSAIMGADTVKSFIEQGTIRNSVNFPRCELKVRDPSNARICIVNDNKPGFLGTLMQLFGDADINIEQQINTSRGSIAYNVIDIAKPKKGVSRDELVYKTWQELQHAIMTIDGVMSSRFIRGSPGSGFAVHRDGEVYFD